MFIMNCTSSCDDIQATVEKLKAKGVEFSGAITDEG